MAGPLAHPLGGHSTSPLNRPLARPAGDPLVSPFAVGGHFAPVSFFCTQYARQELPSRIEDHNGLLRRDYESKFQTRGLQEGYNPAGSIPNKAKDSRSDPTRHPEQSLATGMLIPRVSTMRFKPASRTNFLPALTL